MGQPSPLPPWDRSVQAPGPADGLGHTPIGPGTGSAAAGASGAPVSPGAPATSAVQGSMTGPAGGIRVEHVSRAFGRVHALVDLSMTAPAGQVTALVGPNGCGKSTLMLILAALLAPDAGRVTVAGFDPAVDAVEVRRRVGWMPDQFGTWESLKVREVLATVGAAHFLPADLVARRTAELLSMMRLSHLADQPAHVLSRGQKQRLGMARALIHSPSVLVLDEPASGLDPDSRRDLRDLVRGHAAAGGTVLISSHILSELEEMADRVVVMSAGARLLESGVRELAAAPQRWRIAALDAAGLRDALEDLGVRPERPVGSRRTPRQLAEAEVHVGGEQQAARLLADLTARGVAVVEFGPAAGRVEAAYREATAGSDGAMNGERR